MSKINGVSIHSEAIRVGRYDWKNKTTPKTKGYETILIHVKDPLSPYIIKNNKGQIMENYYQYSKMYPLVEEQDQKEHRYSNKSGWKWPREKHYEKEIVTDKYWVWRKAGQSFPIPVRYPNGFRGKKDCQFIIKFIDDKFWNPFTKITEFKISDKLINIIKKYLGDYRPWIPLNIPQGRAYVYYKTYSSIVRKDPYFKELKDKLKRGIKLQIVEVDGPPDDLNTKPFEKVKDSSISINKYVVQNWIKSKYSFGHGVCLAVALLDKDDWVYDAVD